MHYNVSRHKVSTKISARALCPSAELGGRAAVLCSGMDFIADACSEHMSGRASRDKHRTRAEFCLWSDSTPGHSLLPSSVMLSERPLYARCCQTCSETCPYWSLCYLGLHTHIYIYTHIHLHPWTCTLQMSMHDHEQSDHKERYVDSHTQATQKLVF